IAWRSRHIDALEAELRPLQQAFEKFEWAYAQRVGRLAAELQTLRGTIQQIEQKTARVHARLVSDPGGVLGDIFDRDELREIGEMFGVDVPDDWFANERSGRPDDVEWSWTDETSEEEEILRRLRQERHRRLHGDIGDELRSLYRSLARRFHPDLARSDEERAFRQEVMLRINHAWQCQDLSMLRDIDQELAVIVPGFSPSHMAHRVAWARRERARLDQRAASLMRRIRQLRTSKTFPLWFNPALGQSTSANRAASLERDIAREQERLEDARMASQQALAHYATTNA